MAQNGNDSWARVATDRNEFHIRAGEKLEFTVKVAKKGRVKPSKQTNAAECLKEHCPSSQDYCGRMDCSQRLSRQVLSLRAENKESSANVKRQLFQIDKLREQIDNDCDTTQLFSEDMEISRLGIEKALEAGAVVTACGCMSCILDCHKGESELYYEQSSAAEERLKVLRQFLLAHEGKEDQQAALE